MQSINKNITTDELKEYLKGIIDLEKNIYMQKRTIQWIQKKVNTLGRAKDIPEPEKPDYNSPVGGCFAILSIFIFGMIACLFRIMNLSLGKIFIIVLFILSLLIAGAVVASNISQEIWASKARYRSKMDEYQSNVEADKRRVELELEYKKYIMSELRELKKVHDSTKNLLMEAYGNNIIFPKYRNWVMVCSLYEYISAGRCDSLEGRDGAYNILEMEIRLDRIITQLDCIIESLDAIKNNQYILFSAIEESTRVSNKILDSVYDAVDDLRDIAQQSQKQTEQIEKIRQNSSIAAYCAEQTQRELHYMNRMNYLSGKYNDVFDNMLPN